MLAMQANIQALASSVANASLASPMRDPTQLPAQPLQPRDTKGSPPNVHNVNVVFLRSGKELEDPYKDRVSEPRVKVMTSPVSISDGKKEELSPKEVDDDNF